MFFILSKLIENKLQMEYYLLSQESEYLKN